MFSISNIFTEKDKEEARKLERRRQREQERQSRIFDPRIRKIGVDVNALEHQVSEKKEKVKTEKEYEETVEKKMIANSEIAAQLAAKERQEKQRILNEINDFRNFQQKRIYSRDFDLIDPDALKNEKPPRINDDDDVGLPSGQKFHGEDLQREERNKIMTEQMSSWLWEQMQEKSAKRSRQKEAEGIYERAVIARDERALQLELIERDCKKQLEQATSQFNQLLAKERYNRTMKDRRHDDEDNQAEIYNTLTSDLMTENPNTSRSVFGPHRSITYMYKGMSPQEKEEIRRIQRNQIEDQKIKRETEKRQQYEWENLMEDLTRVAITSASDVQKNKREIAKQTKEENLILAKCQNEKKKYYDKILYRNEPTEEFFKYFNASSR